MTDRKRINMSLTISRTASSQDEGDYVTVAVKSDGARFVKIKLGLKEFADVLTGRSEVPCEGTLYKFAEARS